MKAFSIKSTIVVAIALVSVFSSCVEETLYKIEKEQVNILNKLAYSKGEINTGESAILNPELTLTQETTNVEEFSELSIESSEDFQFSDGQEATLEVTTEGGYTVKKVSYEGYSVEEYSPHRRKITLNLNLQYEYEGEVREVLLSPWYFQEKPEVTPQQPPQADVMSVSAFVKVINNGNGSQTAFPEVNFYKNGELDHSYKCVVNLVKTGQVMGAEVHTTSTSCINEVMECDTLSIEEKVIKDVFKTVTETRLYRLERGFETASGGVISPKNEIKFVLCREITFEAEGHKFSWFFHGGENFTWGFHGNSDTSIGKEIEGTFSPYLGAYTINQEVYVSSFSPQVEGLNGGEPFFSTKAEYHLYKRERVE